MSHRPTPELRLPETTCNPHCRRCHHPEGRGHCHHCLIICDHSRQHPARRRIAEVCITRTRATATLTITSSGAALLLVPNCPHCHKAHPHSGEPGIHPYRRSGCGHTYLLDTP